jgi:hypothetical protein
MRMSNLPWCVYRTVHASGLYYEGKGKTEKVLSGEYKGSGIRFKLALEMPEYAWDTWTATVLETFATEAEAYDREAEIVTHASLMDPLRLNMTAGGQKGKFKTHSTLYRSICTYRRALLRKEKRESAAAKKKADREKLSALKKQLKSN